MTTAVQVRGRSRAVCKAVLLATPVLCPEQPVLYAPKDERRMCRTRAERRIIALRMSAPRPVTTGQTAVGPSGIGSTVAPLDKVQRSPGDKMYLGPEQTAAFVRQVLAEGTYVVCHQTLTYGDNPDFGPADLPGVLRRLRQPVTRADPAAGLPASRRGPPARSCLPGQLT
jgi:hypothetical protein